MMDPVECARRGDVDFFKGVVSDVLLNCDSVLSIAAAENHLDCCEEIYRKSPSLLYYQNRFGSTALHTAAWRGKSKTVKFLISAGARTDFENKEDIESCGEKLSDKKLLTMVDIRRDTALHKAAKKDNFEIVKLLIEADPDNELVKMVNGEKDTALHLAVKVHSLEMVKLLIEVDPDFEYCANASGETPLLIAMREGRSHGSTSASSSDIRKLILEKQPSQSKIRTRDNGWTSLHHAAYNGDLSSIQDIIRFCPDCAELVDNEGRNFLHLAAKFEHVEVVKHVLGTKEIPASILNGQDKHGNTPLQIAALTGNESIVLCLLHDSRVTKMNTNSDGQMVTLTTINFYYTKEKAGIYGVFRDRVTEKELKVQSNFDLLVGALIATVSFTAGITVPGGYTSEGPDKGMAVLSKKISFEAFVISNNFALLFSLYAVFSHFCRIHLFKKEDILYQLNVSTFCTLGSIFAMMVAFITGSYAVLASSDRLAITVCVNSCCFFLFAFRAMWTMVMQYKHPVPIEGLKPEKDVEKNSNREEPFERDEDSILPLEEHPLQPPE